MSASAKARPAGGRLDVAAADLGEAQELQRLDQDEHLLVGDLLALGEMRQVGAAGIGRLAQRARAGR